MYQTGYRFLIRMGLVVITIPVMYFVVRHSVGYVTGPTLYEGDQLENRPCRECNGKGFDPTLAEVGIPAPGGRCPACSGRGNVDIILPGPNRPTRVWGAVVSTAFFGGEDGAAALSPSAVRGNPLETAFLPDRAQLPGGIPGSSVAFEREGAQPIEVKVNSTGRFSQRLVSGAYKVKVSAPGYERVEGELVVKPLKDAIWLEKASILREDISETEVQAAYGLTLLIGMARPDERGGFVRLCPSFP